MSLEVRFSRPAPVPVPDKTKPKPRDTIQPRLLGWLLFILSHILDRLGFLQRWVWHQAGFDALRGIAEQIGPVDPRLDPTVLPRHDCISLETKASRSEDVRETETSSPQANSVVGYRSAFLSGRLTPLELVNSILPLIRRDITPAGKHSTAWIEVKSNLIIASAEESTQRYKQKRSLGPLDGIPVAVKECFDVIGYKKNLGTRFDLTSKDANGNEFDSWCILKLKEAGAIIMGKVSMHELGLDTSGTNVTFGTPRNPYNPMYYTGGSSSGSAYAVASGLVPLALGTDGGGSVRIPSSFCSVFGLKPTHGRLSYLPGQSLANTCEVIGPIAADMQSLAAFFEVIGQGHPDSCFPSTIPRLLSDIPGRRKVLGIPKDWFQCATPTIQKMCHRIVETLVSRKGYTTVPIQIPFTAEGQIAHALTMLTDASVELNGNTAFISSPNRIFASLGRATPGSDYVLAQKLRHVLMRHLAYLWETHPGMLIITPTTACPGWPIRSEAELQFGISDGKQTMKTMEYVWLANFCEVPSLSVPAGFVVPDGQVGEGSEAVGEEIMGKVPVGLMATAEWTCEHALVQFGLDVEGILPRLQEHPPEWVDGLALNST